MAQRLSAFVARGNRWTGLFFSSPDKTGSRWDWGLGLLRRSTVEENLHSACGSTVCFSLVHQDLITDDVVVKSS
jgi:hypothetical protein